MKEIFQFRISYFLRCAECRTLTEAAQLLGVTQPTLSLALKQLETDLGKKLLERDRHGIRLTREGEVFRENMLSLYSQAEQAMSASHPRPCLRVGSPPYFVTNFLLPAIEANPRKVFETLPLQIHTHRSFQIYEAVREGKLHFGFIAWTHKPKDLSYVPVFKEHTAIAGLRKTFSSIEKAKSLDELKQFPWVEYPKPQYEWTEILRGGTPGYVVADSASLKSLILGGYAIGEVELDDFSAEEQSRLSICPVKTRHDNVYIFAVWKKLDAYAQGVVNSIIQAIQSRRPT